MSDVVVSAIGLGKEYRYTGERTSSYRTLRETVANFSLSGRDSARAERDSFWALSDVSFEARQGDVVGVVGANGAGKSTLLKILSRITEPTHGHVDVTGRIASLLEVGTGFHPELTGRENILLSGAILGMRHAEIKRKLPEIVEFAEVERFLDTPAKHFSSGMYLRLAFAVAAHLEPDILLVDEVLAVGDQAFQRKCLGKMEDVANGGRTVFLVSHNLAAVRELCRTGLILDRGRVAFHGSIVDGLAHYASLAAPERKELPNNRGSILGRPIVNGGPSLGAAPIDAGSPFHIHVRLELQEPFESAYLFLFIDSSSGQRVVHQRVDTRDIGRQRFAAGRHEVRVTLPGLWLAPGVYTAYLKFSGRTAHGSQTKIWSERAMLDACGGATGSGGAVLAPHIRWDVRALLQEP